MGIFGGDMFRIIYLKGDMFLHYIRDIYMKGDFSVQSIFHFIFNQFDWLKMTYRENLPSSSLSRLAFSFRNFLHRTHMKCRCQIMVEDAAVLDYIKNKVPKCTEEIIFHYFSLLLKSVSNRMNSWYKRN